MSQERSPIKQALVRIHELEARLEEARRREDDEPVAVVGLSCRFPGADCPEAYWSLLRDGVDAVRAVPSDRWEADAYVDPDPDVRGKMVTAEGGFLEDVIGFEPALFGISPREAQRLDPQQRLLLEVTWEALERAGRLPGRLAGSDTGVFIGITTGDHAQRALGLAHLADLEVYDITGSAHNAAAGRLSYCFGFHGPCAAVDTACSSSLVAIHLACRSLTNGECDSAVAGGVNLMLSPVPAIALSRGRVLSPSGRCRAFAAAADGMVRGEGCGIVLLRRLSDARRDGDDVLAVIRGSAVNQDGPASGLTVPNGPAQEALLRRALSAARLKPEEVDYVEAHGTGTPLGDPIELRALGEVLARKTSRERPLLVGSVKTNIGHLEAAAGVAGLIKVILALEHGAIPPHLHFDQPTPMVAWDELAVAVPTELTPWARGTRPRRAGVSGFGFSGTNAHVLLEEAPDTQADSARRNEGGDRPVHALVLRARNQGALDGLAVAYAARLADPHAPAWANVCYTANTGRARLPERLAVVAGSSAEAAAALIARSDGASGTIHGRASAEAPRIAFLFSGQGAQVAGAGRALYDREPVFRRAIDRCSAAYRGTRGLIEIMFETDQAELARTELAQPALFALEYALTQTWALWGVHPSLVLGHSLGEYVAACVAGVFEVEQAMALVVERARLMGQLPDDGAMLAVEASEADVAARLEPATALVIAAVNAPDSVVVSGPAAAIAELGKQLSAESVRVHLVAVSQAFHSPLVEPILPALGQALDALTLRPPRIGIVSNVTGKRERDALTRSDYWLRHTRQAVRFADGVRTLGAENIDVFLEIGPRPVLTGLTRRTLDEAVCLTSLRPGLDEWRQMLESAVALEVRGADIDWHGVDRGWRRQRVCLPTYPFQREPYPPRELGTVRVRSGPALHPLLGDRLDLPGSDQARHESQLAADHPAWLSDHRVLDRILLPASAFLEMALASRPGSALADVTLRAPLELPPAASRRVQVVCDARRDGSYGVRIFSSPSAGQGPWILHASGRLERPLANHRRQGIDVSQIRARCVTPVPVDRLYREARDRGIVFGPRFQVLQEAFQAPGEALARVALGDRLRSDSARYELHPVLLDGCLQALLAIDADVDTSKLFLPVSVRRLELHARSGPDVWCWARLQAAQPDALTVDFTLFNDQGGTVAELAGLELRRIDAARLARTDETGDWLYRIAWPPAPAANGSRAEVAGTWLIVGAGDGLAAAVVEAMVATGARAKRVADPGALAAAQEITPARGIIDLRACAARLDDGHDESQVLAACEAVCTDALDLIRAVTAGGAQSPPPLWLATRGGQGVSHGEAPALAQSCLWGLGRAAALEHPELDLTLVDLDPLVDVDRAVRDLLEELALPPGERQTAWRRGSRHVARLTHHKIEPGRAASRPDGAYLISGGTRGLGWLTARYLIDSGVRCVVLVGRSSPPAEVEREIAELGERSGASIHVLLADVADRHRLEEALATLPPDLPPIRGLVHSAGVLDDARIAELDGPRLRRVLGPKIAGAWSLEHALGDLETVVFYSSAAAILGSAGQCSHSAANAFLDALAVGLQAHGKRAISIGWGPWSEVGSAAGGAISQRLERKGLRSIPPDLGIDILDRLLSGDESTAHVGVIRADWSVVLQSVGADETPPFLAEVASMGEGQVSTATDPATLRDLDPDARRVRLMSYLETGLRRVLDVPGKLPLDTPLSALGLDSLMAVELRNRVRDDLGVALPVGRILSGPSVADLATDIARELAAPGPPEAGSDCPLEALAPDQAQALLGRLDELSDDEVARLLGEDPDRARDEDVDGPRER